MDVLEKEILKYEKRGFTVAQKRTLKHGSRTFLKREHEGFLSSSFEGVYIYYVNGDSTSDSLRECFKDYAKFYEAKEFDEGDKGFYLCSGSADEKLFKDLRKAMIRDDDVRNSIKLISPGKMTKEKVEEERPKRGIEKATPGSSEILARIKKFTIRKMPKREKDLDSMLVSYLSAFYPDISTRNTYQNVDAQIGDTGIEIKYQPSSSEFDRLYGQVEKYLKHLEKVIVVIGYEKSRELTETFEKRIKERGWLNSKVFIVPIR
jgi:hypothetical protein